MQEKGTVKTVTFHNPDNGYSVLKFVHADTQKEFAVVGTFPRLKEGEFLEIEGDWVTHPTYGKQLKSTGYKILTPETKDHIEKYLGSGILKGVGPAQAKIVVEHFGEDTFHILDTAPDKVKTIKGLGPKKAENILKQWQENQSLRGVMYFLQTHNLSLNISSKIYKHYGNTAVEKLKANPYILAEDIWGVGFIKADHIAQKLGFDLESYERLKAGLVHSLNQSGNEGHVFLPKQDLIDQAARMLSVPRELLIYTLDNLVDNTSIYQDELGNCYKPYLYYSEIGIAKVLSKMYGERLELEQSAVAAGIEEAQQLFSEGNGTAFQYLDHQKHAIEQGVTTGTFLFTGGPGTGKTSTLVGMLRVFLKAGLNVKLTAPTGRAAKRMQELCQQPASTIHRLLQYEPDRGAFKHNEHMPLEVDVVIADEVSMMDTSLMYALIKAIKPTSRLLLVGDPDQLPSVGPGKVLAELIQSKCVPHVHLTQIMRQEENSPIVANAHKIMRGEPPQLESQDSRFQFIECRNPSKGLEQALNWITQQASRQSLDPFQDVQILTPMNRGLLGGQHLNEKVQSILNPKGPSLTLRDITYSVGDKVMQLRNNYDKNIYNGDIGRIRSISPKDKSIAVQFDDIVEYQWEELDQLGLAYAITIHKSQGSEFKTVVLFLHNEHHVLLQRNLFYTALTRARDQIVLVGSRNAIRRAVENNPTINRHTRLASHLEQKHVPLDLPF